MSRHLTNRDIKVLQTLREIGPGNISKVSRIVGVSRKSLTARLKRMHSDPRFFLRMHTSVYHTNLGLRKCVVFLSAMPGKEQLLFDCLSSNSFWLYLCRSYGSGEGCTAVYAIPVEHCAEFEEFIHELKRLNVASHTRIYWSTCFQGGRITPEWFDSSQERWEFKWKDWINEVQTQSMDLPVTLKEADSYTNLADLTDVKMLEKLEADATRSLSFVSRSIGISRQLAQHHYVKHLLAKNLIEGYEIFVMRYGDAPFVMAYFAITFDEYDKYARFARSLLNKFFAITMGKMIGKDGILVEVFLPTEEFRRFVDTLSEMARMKLVTSYRYAIQDVNVRARQTIWPQFFQKKSWIYDHKSHMETLHHKIPNPAQ